ncbi:glycine cleavage system aminomethyltransferase GcvT [Bacillus niameyensis]|uniref:glycine cleavage system aminomethyltransferase GcvT n=1 Tax=Bacillus niameyensis TaxID=1522308 RepID=UPI000780DEAA|nr:glycine cleavage system aminomethyltransferase GcvT [Bacillus niameyensis]
MTTLKRTPLDPLYEEMGAKTIDFGGWALPVQFSSIKDEHHAVRTKAGLFDVSHMGEVIVKGKDSLKFLQKMLTNDLAKLKAGEVLYTAMCYDDGGTVDDLLVYQLAEMEYLLVVNAANTEKDFEWLTEHIEGEVTIENVSNEYALLAIQGPASCDILQSVVNVDMQGLKFFNFWQNVQINGANTLLSRTGYTGEDGFEIYCNPKDATMLWKLLLETGEKQGLLPCGLGARDTLRFEACLPLYGQELSKNITPLEAGIGFAVKLNKSVSFIGQKSLQKQKEDGISRKNVGIEMIDRGIPRQGYKVYDDHNEIGEVTSGTQSPTLKKNVGLALIDIEQCEIGREVFVDIRGKRLKAKIISKPFYARQKNK